MGKIRLDRMVVIDVESTCWETRPPKGQESEIIEIGVCLLNLKSGFRENRESILVIPERSTISKFCTKLTTLTQEQVMSEGMSLADACRYLMRKYDTRNRAWASYGDYDRRQFERQCARKRAPYPFSSRHVNVKLLFALIHGLDYEVGMATALKKLNQPLEGTHHRGVDDAYNIAGILAVLLKRIS